MVRIGYGLVVAFVVFAGFVAPARGGAMFYGPYPNPGSLPQPNGYYFVDAFDAAADALSQSWNQNLPTPAQVIQTCMNKEYTYAHQNADWPIPQQGNLFANISFTANTQAQPNNYSAYATSALCGATLIMTATNWPAGPAGGTGEHWLQLIHLNYSVDSIPPGTTWPDPNGHGYWAVDNENTPGKPFYDLVNPPIPGASPPNFEDQARGPWNGTSFFSAYLFVADINADREITLHDVVTWGWGEPKIDPTPEPATLTLALVGSGTLGLFGYLRRQKKVA